MPTDVDAGAGAADARSRADALTSPSADAASNVDGAGASIDASTGLVDAQGSPGDAAPDAAPAPPPTAVTAPPYLMWMTQTEVSVRWETSTDVVGYVDYGAEGNINRRITEAIASRVHEVRLTGLAPGQVHAYRIGWDSYSLPQRSFRTAPPDGDNSAFNFVVWGDNQNGPDVFRGITSLMDTKAPAFAVSTGDCVQNGTRPEYRSQLFDPITSLADHVPFLVAAGNHERYSDSEQVIFDDYMSQPRDEHCFGWRWGPLYIMFVDSEDPIDPGTPQGDCIIAGLSSTAATTATFRAAAFHKPPRIEWWGGGSVAFIREMEAPWIRETLEPMLEDLNVDVVFNGHNHLYTHTPKTPGGITWVTTGGGGGSLDTNFFLWRVATWPEITTTIHEYHFLSVEVDGPTMTVTAVGTDGSTLHQFTVAAD